MRYAKTVAAILLTLSVADCASPSPKIYFWHPGATNEELHRDMADCRMKLAMVPATPLPENSVASLGAALQDRESKNAFFQDCMTAKGWQMVTEPR